MQSAIDRLRALGIQAGAAVGDVTVAEEADSTVETAIGSFGQIDILINNVGRGLNMPTATMPFSHWTELIEKNLTSVFRMCQLVAPAMLERQCGSIVNL